MTGMDEQENMMNWKHVLAGVAAIGLMGCGSVNQAIDPSEASAVVRPQAAVAAYPYGTLLARHFPASGETYYNASIDIRGNITDTWYDSVTVALRFCGYKNGVRTTCKDRTYTAYKNYPSYAPGIASEYIVCKITDGSTEIRISGQNRSPIVAANPDATVTVRDGNDDFGPRPSDYPSCN
jgi:hypothetical protein